MKTLVFRKGKGKSKLRAGMHYQKEDVCGSRLISLEKAKQGKNVKKNLYSYCLTAWVSFLVGNIMDVSEHVLNHTRSHQFLPSDN